MEKLENIIKIDLSEYIAGTLDKANKSLYNNENVLANYYMKNLMDVNRALNKNFELKYTYNKKEDVYFYEIND